MWLVYKKELLELTRDRKTLIFTILMPILILPLIMGGFVYFNVKMEQKKQDEILNFSIIGASNAPQLSEKLKSVDKLLFISDIKQEDIKNVIRDNTVKFVIVIPNLFEQTLKQNKQAKIILHYNAASQASKVKSRLEELITVFNKKLQLQRTEILGIGKVEFEALLEPVVIETESIADDREKYGEIAGGLAAYFLLIITLSGAIYPALDLGVGEKERQTLETLLLNPLPRWHLVIAKFLVIFTTGFISVFLSLFSILLWSILVGQAFAVEKIAEMLNILGIGTISMMLLMLIPTAAFFAATLLSISIYARNFKEAQNYISPLMFIVIIPVMVAMIPGVELNWTTAMIPLTNISLAMKEIIKGTMDFSMIFAIFASISVLASGMLWFCTRWFQKESVLFRS